MRRRPFAYRRRATPLHAARATIGGLYGLALAACALLVEHPLVLLGLLAAVLAAGLAAGAGQELRRALPLAAGLVALTVLVNVLVSRQGLTVFARLGDWGPLGQEDLTVEALVYGLVVGLRWVIVLFASVVVSAAVDPDELLRAFRCVSPRSALSAVLATRLVPVLFEDGARMAEAQRCRADGGQRGRRRQLVVLRAVVSGALDRALDVAAALEVRGYGAGRRPRRVARAWSRHDWAFAVAAAGCVTVAVAVRATGVGAFETYPLLHADLDAQTVGAAAVLAAVVLAPFAQRRGVEP